MTSTTRAAPPDPRPLTPSVSPRLAPARDSISRPFAFVTLLSFAAILLAYLYPAATPGAQAARALVFATWAALCAFVGALLARREAADFERTAWSWLAAGCGTLFVSQVVLDVIAFRRGAATPLPYPLVTDVAAPMLFVAFAFALRGLTPPSTRRREPDVGLDAGLVTFTAAALGYVLVLVPLFQHAGATLALVTSTITAVLGIALVWAIARGMVQRRTFPAGTAGIVAIAVVLIASSGVIHVRHGIAGALPGGDLWDLSWDAGLLMIAGAGAFTRGGKPVGGGAMAGMSGEAARVIAVLVAVAGIAALAVSNAMHAEQSAATTLWVIAGVAIIGVRFIYALRADRRYAELLEREVATQTRSLMDSLAATATAERNLRLVMEAVPEAMFVLDPDGRVADMNAAGRSMLASVAATHGGQPVSIFDLLDADVRPTLRHHLETALRGEVRRFEIYFPRPDTTRGVYAILYAPIREGWRVSHVLASVRDITDLKRTESQLQQAEKLAAMGQLVSGVAHEVNNPAAIISGFAQTLLLEELRPEQRDMTQMIYDEATRIGRITQNLLAFARAGGKERTLVDLNDILRRTFALRSYHLSTLNITVGLELDQSDPKIWANASEVQQMLLNLMINAEQALVTVETPRKITIRSTSTDQEVRFEVSDNGPGVGSEVRGRVFDPFFTTKPEGVGTGLGLSICYGIVQEHGGRIWLDSEPGQGATFRVALPRDPRAEVRPPAEEPVVDGKASVLPLRVLLLDDEAALGDALLRYLLHHGIEVRTVADGGAALRALQQDEFDVIVSDVRMPGMNGREFIAQLRRERPKLVQRLIFSTGDTFAEDTAQLLDTSGVPTVSKPFDFAVLENLIRRVAAGATT
ncbi:MAG TPA: ATP-binding protein [Gemmatimonadales bacterium]|nr:ATP-binding protein [Gemmatimonadales bacterium]